MIPLKPRSENHPSLIKMWSKVTKLDSQTSICFLVPFKKFKEIRLITSSSGKMWKIDWHFFILTLILIWFFCLKCRMPGLSCRFYQHKFPEVEDVVMVNVRSIAEMGAYVSLLEYNNIEGMILLSELSRRRIRSINKLIRIGRNECVVVIRVDKEKGKW